VRSNRKRILAPVALLLAALASEARLGAQPAGPQALDPLTLPRTRRVVISRIQGPVTLDGMSGEPAWQSATPFPLIQQTPQFGAAPTERTEVLMAFDEQFLYVAGRMYDREPDKIQSPTKKRDAMVSATDWFGMVADTFNDKENGLIFMTTPSGLRFDGAAFNDAQPTSQDMNGMPINLSWNTFWDVATVRTREGWFAEMKIPLSSLRFQDEGGKVVMGVIFSRWIARKNENDIFPAIPMHWGQLSQFKSSQAQEIEFHGLQSKKPFYITPYVLAGHSRSYELNEAGTAYLKTKTPKLEFGLDVKTGLTNNLTLDITANTDFAQVEADDAQVNLTRFSLFFPEKRLFFQERTSNFDFNMGGSNTLFYSRRIGLYDGHPVRIYGGARVVGRVGGWDLGFLDMQTAAFEDQPSENFGVLRLRRRVFNPNSYVGGIVTSRLGTDGSYNVDYGLDGVFRVVGNDYFTFHWAQTFENGAANTFGSLDQAKVGLCWERRTQKGFAYSLRAARVGENFDPGMGFMMRENYTALHARTLYGWFPDERSSLVNHDAYIDGLVYWDNATRRVQSVDFGPGWEFATKSGWMGSFGPKLYYEDVTESFTFSDYDAAEVPVGKYTFGGFKGMFMTPQGNLLSGAMFCEAGSFYDGGRVSLGLMPQWSIVPDLELSGMLEYNYVRFPSRRQTFIAPIAQLRLMATITTRLSASVMVQYSGADDAVTANFRFRFNPSEGTDLYVVYNEGLNTDRLRKSPVPPFSSDRTIAVKFNYTFNL
jgi:hypothetical protein